MAGAKVDDDELEQFRGTVRGDVLTPADEGFDANPIFNTMHNRRPALKVRATGTADVVDRSPSPARNLVVAVRGGGRSVAAGLSSKGTTYTNFTGQADESADALTRNAHGPNTARLQAIKKQYDPDNFFRINPNILPAYSGSSLRFRKDSLRSRTMHLDEREVRVNEYVDQVRDAFTAQAAGDLEPARRLLGADAVLNVPAFLPVSDPRGFDGLVSLMLEMMSRCDGGFASTFIDSIGAGRIVTAVNEVNATRNGRSITYNTVWTFRFTDDVVAEAWLHPSLAEEEIARFYGFDEA